MTPFALIARSRLRLGLAALLGLIPVFGIGVPGFGWIREQSTSASLDLGIITAWMLLMLAEASILALFVAAALFGDRWRQINVMGQRTASADEELTEAASLSAGGPSGPVAAFGLTVIIAAVGGLLIAIAPGQVWLWVLGIVALFTGGISLFRARAKSRDELAQLAAASRPHIPILALLVVFFTAAQVFSVNVASDGFFGWFGRYGYATSTLRGSDSALKVSILRRMTRAQDERLVTFVGMMKREAFGAETQPEVRVAALWALGEVCRRMVKSVDLMDRGQPGGAWARGLHTDLQETVAPELLRRFEAAPDGEEGRALVFGLGALRSEDALAVFRTYLKRPTRDRAVVLEVIKALSAYRDPNRTVSLLLPLMGSEDGEVAGLAVWALGENYGLGTGSSSEDAPDPALVDMLRQRLPRMPLAGRCMALDALLRIRAEALGPTLFDIFDRVSPPDRRCPRQTVKRPFEMDAVASREEEEREKLVQALAAIAEGNSKVMAWLRRRSRDPTVAEGLRDDMGYILDVLRQRPTRR